MSMGVLRAGESCLFQFVWPYPPSFVTEENRSFSHDVTAAIFTRDDVVSQRLKFGSTFLSSSWESKIALFF